MEQPLPFEGAVDLVESASTEPSVDATGLASPTAGRLGPPDSAERVPGDEARSHCPAGHPYDEANTYVNRKGWRSCRICQGEARRRWRSRNAKSLTPEQRVLRSRAAAYRLHATHDPKETTKKARAAFASRFEREVDPEMVLDPAERARRAEAARRAYFTDLALRSSRARQRFG
jgi:hypothetical protein